MQSGGLAELHPQRVYYNEGKKALRETLVQLRVKSWTSLISPWGSEYRQGDSLRNP